VVPALIDHLQNDDVSRYFTAVALGKFGHSARAAVPALTSLEKELNPAVSSAAEYALKAIAEAERTNGVSKDEF